MEYERNASKFHASDVIDAPLPPPPPANIDYSIHLRKKILASSLVPENWRKISKGIGYIPYRDIVRTIRILQRDNLTGLIRLAIWQVVTISLHGLIIPLLLLVGWSCVFWTQNWFLILNWCKILMIDVREEESLKSLKSLLDYLCWKVKFWIRKMLEIVMELIDSEW